MSASWRDRAARLGANTLFGLGMGVCGLGMWLAVLGLVEGVTLLAGEGTRLLPESPEQVRKRLILIGCLLGAAAVGWLLARLGESFRQAPGVPWRRRLVTVGAEQLLFLGGVSVAVGCLIGGASLQADRPVPSVYYTIALGAAVAALILLPAGGVLYRRVRSDAVSGSPAR
jgi:hypothetical protein